MNPRPPGVLTLLLLLLLALPAGIGAMVTEAEEGELLELDAPAGRAGLSVADSTASSSAKSKVLYFHNDTPLIGGANRTQTANSTLGANRSTVCTGGAPCAGSQITLTFYQYPAMSSNATVNGSVAAILWLSSTQGNNMFVDLTLTVMSISPAGASTTHVTSPTVGYDPVTSHFSEYRVATPNATFTVAAGSHLVFELQVRADNSRNVFIAWGDDLYRSRAVVPMQSHMRVTDTVTLDANRTAQISFDPAAATRIVIFNATVDDPLGDYDIRYTNLSLEGPVGSILIRAIMTRGGGPSVGGSAWFELVWNYSGYPVGRYNFTVEAVDNTGYYYRFPSNVGDLTYGGHLESRSGFFYVGSAPVPVHVLAIDSLAAPLPQAVVGVKSAGRYFVDINRTDAAGRAVLTSSIGSFRFVVFWQAVEVYNESRTVSAANNATNPLILRAMVHTGAVRVVDVAFAPVAGALVHLRHPNSTALAPRVTNPSGEVGMTRMAGGVYGLRVDFRGVDVFAGDLTFDGNRTFVIRGEVYYLTVVVKDLTGRPLPGAIVSARDNVTDIVADSRATDTVGVALARLPKNVYDIEVRWLETLVNRTPGYALGGNATLAISALVFTVSLKLVDSRSIPVEAAQVEIVHPNGRVVLTGVTGPGGVSQVQAPAGTFRLMAHWAGALVKDDPAFLIDRPGEKTVPVDVFYLTARLVDSRGVPVVSAEVATDRAGALVGSAVTGADGKVDLRVPVGDTRVVARWYGVQVHQSTQIVTRDDARDLTASVFYLTVRPRDSRGAAVAGASIDAWVTSALVSTSVTDASGDAEVRAPATSVTITVTWRGVEVASERKVVTTDESILIAAQVYYLTVKVSDREGKAIGDAEVSVRTSLLVESNFTAGDGATLFRLPNQTYEIVVRYRTAYYLTPVDVSTSKSGVVLAGDAEVSVVLSDYPPSVFATGAFTLGLLFALLAILMLLLVYLIIKKRRAGHETATVATEDRETKASSDAAGPPSDGTPTKKDERTVMVTEAEPAAAEASERRPGKRAVPPPFAALPPSEVEQPEEAPEADIWPGEERAPSQLDREEDFLQPLTDAAERKDALDPTDRIVEEESAVAKKSAASDPARPTESGSAAPPAAPRAALKMGEAKEEGKCPHCEGTIKPGSLVAACECGANHHVACGKRAKRCGSCGKEFGTAQQRSVA